MSMAPSPTNARQHMQNTGFTITPKVVSGNTDVPLGYCRDNWNTIPPLYRMEEVLNVLSAITLMLKNMKPVLENVH